MNSKLRNTLSALTVATGFLTLGYAASEPAVRMPVAPVALAAADAPAHATAVSRRSAQVGMPYYSFAKRTARART